MPDVALQLGVRFVVEGSVRLSNANLRISTQLIDAASGHALWSGRFDRRKDEAVDLQEDIARGIISELEPALKLPTYTDSAQKTWMSGRTTIRRSGRLRLMVGAGMPWPRRSRNFKKALPLTRLLASGTPITLC